MVQDQAKGIAWDFDVPLLTNRYMLGAMTKAMLGAALGCTLLVAFPLAIQGEWDAIPPLAALFAMIGSGLFLLSLLVMAFPFRNRMKTRFEIDDAGVRIQLTDSTARFSNRAAFWVGLVLGKPGAAGTGMLAMSQEQQSLGWDGAYTARFEPATRSIAFRNGWRTLMRIYCLPENYETAVTLVQDGMAAHATASRVKPGSPLGGYLWRTLLVILCSVPLFMMAEEFDLSGFTPFLMLCFALAMVWLIRPLALVVLGALVTMAGGLALSLMEQRQSYFSDGTYLHYQVLSGDDWAGLFVCALAAGVLSWLSIAILRGRYTPALTQDWGDAGDD